MNIEDEPTPPIEDLLRTVDRWDVEAMEYQRAVLPEVGRRMLLEQYCVEVAKRVAARARTGRVEGEIDSCEQVTQ